MFYVLMNRYCTVIVLFPQPNALCVKSQDVYVICSTFSNKGKQKERTEQSQELRLQVKRDRSEQRGNRKREIDMRQRELE